MLINKISAIIILSSSGNPTIKLILDTNIGFFHSSYAYGASAGTLEATTVFDSKDSWNKKGMDETVELLNSSVNSYFQNKSYNELNNFDEELNFFIKNTLKHETYSNISTPLSMAVCRALASENGMELYEYINQLSGSKIVKPSPMVVVIEGGKHGENSTNFQEYLITNDSNESLINKLRLIIELMNDLKSELKINNYSRNIGSEGAFVIENVTTNEVPLELIKHVIDKDSKYNSLGLALDIASSEFFDKQTHKYKLLDEKILDSRLFIDYLCTLQNKYSLYSIEDPLAEFDNWDNITNKLKCNIIGDDLTVTNPDKLLEFNQDINGIIIKPNQCGFISKTIETCKLANKLGKFVIVSHRGGGESNDDFISDLAVGVGAKFIKCGITRGERVSKYNRLLEIEENIKN